MEKGKIKKLIGSNPLGKWLMTQRENFNNWHYYQKRKPYIPALTELFMESEISIISSNCFAGRVMQDLKMEYNSPTLGLYFMYPDYIEFLQHLEHYLKNGKLTFVEHSKYALGDERRAARTISHHWYPIGLIDGKVEIHFLHYHTEEEAAGKWYRRAARVNFENLLVIGMDQNRCTEQDIRDFDALPFKRKLIFSTHEMTGVKSNVFMKEFAGKDSVGDAYKNGDLFYKYLVDRLNKLEP